MRLTFTTALSGANIPLRLCTHVGCMRNEHLRATRTRRPHSKHSADEYATTVRGESLTCGAIRLSSRSSHRSPSHAACTALLLSTETAPSARSADVADLRPLVVPHASAERSAGTTRKIHDQTSSMARRFSEPEKKRSKKKRTEIAFFSAMGKNIIHVGAQGAGQTVKLVNQILVVGNALAMSEALLFAQAGGVDVGKALAAVSGGAAGSWMLSNRGPQILNRDWRPGFTIDLQQKDLRLVLEAADEVGVPLPGTALIFQLYRTLQRAGLGHEGNHALVKALEQLARIEINTSAS